MTVSTMYAPIEYEGDGESVAFAIPWIFLEADDLRLYLVNPTTEAKTSLSAFVATGAGVEAGGTVTLPAAPSAGLVLRIERRTDRDQEMDLTPQGRFPAVSLERAADKLTLIVQELDYQLGGSDSGGDGSASTPGITILENFPEKDVQWARDDAGDLWNGETELGFRSDFDVSGMNWLHFVKSKFSAALGIATGRFAVYGEESSLLYDGALPDGDYYGIEEFAVPIDISSYRYLAICMDPGVSAAEQPIAQTMTRWPLPIASSFGPGNRWVSAHMVEHDHNSAWPETAPGLPVVPTIDPVGSIKYCITRWCAIGVSV